MITVNEALAILACNLPGRRAETLPLPEAGACYLEQDIMAPEPSPRYTNSAMDGYAVRWQDVHRTSPDNPVILETVGESRAGEPFSGTVEPGQTVRISTGACLPEGCDTIVKLEDADDLGNRVKILDVRRQGQDVRYEGEEFQAGDLLLAQGTGLKTRQLALLASVGFKSVPVFAMPRVALLVTGTELVSRTDRELKNFQIRDSNTIMLEHAVKEDGGVIVWSSRVQDDLASTHKVIERALGEMPDLILCSGGVSVGRHDHVKKAAETAGFAELFWKIRQKPGKPLFAAKKGDALLFGLPGNPVSAFMCYRHYVRPVLLHLVGQPTSNESVTARTPEVIANHGSRTNFLRVKAEFTPGEIPRITEVKKQGSHMLSSITDADGYIILEPGQTLEPGSLTEVFLF